MIKIIATWLTVSIAFTVFGQNEQTMYKLEEFKQIPVYEDEYSANTSVARMIDGLIYRFFWATEGLSAKDIAYRPEGDQTKSIEETMDHMYGLSSTIRNTCLGEVNLRPLNIPEAWGFEERRLAALSLLKEASDALKNGGVDVSDLKVVFERSGKQNAFPFWNLINGPIADALYHTGQIVSYRRSAGNPMDPMVNVFIGKNKDN